MRLVLARTMLLALLAAILIAAFAPLEKTLGTTARLVYFHGAWVWSALAMYLAAGVTGAIGLIWRKQIWLDWSQALGRSGLVFWLIFLPMSLIVMTSSWNGLYLDEPRFRMPFNFAVISLLLQTGLVFFPNRSWTGLANLLFSCVLIAALSSTQSVLHPESPIFNAQAGNIRWVFSGLTILLSLTAGMLAAIWKHRTIPIDNEHS